MTDETEDETRSYLRKAADALMQKAEEQEEESTGSEAGQKQPEDEGGEDDGDAVDELINALADEMGVPAAELRDRLGQSADDEDEGDDDEPEDDEVEGKSEDEGTDITVNFGEKLEEHGVVTEDELEQKMDDLRSDVVEDVGEKLAETQEEAVEEVAQKMQEGSTPNPAGGSFQDGQDFESQLEEVTSGEGW